MMKITLANLSEATESKIFRQVYLHALAQGALAIEDDQRRYRTHSGLKCPVGCLIDDSEYKPEFEGKSWNDLVKDSVVPYAHEHFILWLQIIHDQSYNYEDWLRRTSWFGVSQGILSWKGTYRSPKWLR
ncbi:MAG: hypothetical protein MN733_36855 [Nitrososphaera sp.]|nr:hypothetical protein [Nitrososphaera sp.]